MGIANASFALEDDDLGGTANGWGMAYSYAYHAGAYITGNNVGNNAVLMIAIDLDDHKLWYGKNGSWLDGGDPAAGTGAQYADIHAETLYPALSIRAANSSSFHANFGESAFDYSVPSGFNSGWYTEVAVVEGSTAEGFSLDDTFSPDSNVRSIDESMTLSDSMVESAEFIKQISNDLSLSDMMTPLHLSDGMSESIGISGYMEADEIIWIKNTFPNLSGKHLTLKFTPSGSALYFMRMKMFKTVDRVDFDARHPNLSGNHLTLKIQHTANEDFLLAYASMGIHGKIE
jgi:hypothetical protein